MPFRYRLLAPSLASLILVGSLGLGPAMAQPLFGALDATSAPQIRFSTEAPNNPIYPGAEVTIAGQGFRPGQNVRLLYGAYPLLPDSLVADGEGRVTGRISVPPGASVGSHPIIVVAQEPYGATLATLKISPRIPFSGQAGYEVIEARVARGLYQSAYSVRNRALFVTAAVGRPPVRQSELLRVNPETLEVVARVTPRPAEAPAPRPGTPAREGGVHAVYGVGVDDANDTVWVTNTRQDTVAVYRQSDLSLIRQFAPGTVNHARDVVVDDALGKAYASATFRPEVVVFNTASPEVARRIEITTRSRAGMPFSAASLSLNTEAHRLYVVSNSTNEVAVIDTRTDRVERVLAVPGARSAIGVSHDPRTGRIFVAAQGSDNLVVLDGEKGEVIATTPVGAGALNVVFDPVGRRAYVASRGVGTVTVTDADGRIVANLGPTPLANHVATDGRGAVFVVDKSANARQAESDTLLRVRPRS